MSKKNAKKELKKWERYMEEREGEWAEKRDKYFPLSIADRMQFRLERFIEQRFQQSKDLIVRNDRFHATSKDAVIRGYSPKFCPFLIRDGVAIKDGRYKFMPEVDTRIATADIIDIFNGTTRNNEGHIMISLSSKYQHVGDNFGGRRYNFGRAAIIVSPSLIHTDYLCIRDEDEIVALLYAGVETDDEQSQNVRKKGIFETKDKNMQSHAAEMEEFCVLAEIEENKEYIFTLFSRKQGVLFAETLYSLDDVEFVAENGKVEVIQKRAGKKRTAPLLYLGTH